MKRKVEVNQRLYGVLSQAQLSIRAIAPEHLLQLFKWAYWELSVQFIHKNDKFVTGA